MFGLRLDRAWGRGWIVVGLWFDRGWIEVGHKGDTRETEGRQRET